MAGEDRQGRNGLARLGLEWNGIPCKQRVRERTMAKATIAKVSSAKVAAPTLVKSKTGIATIPGIVDEKLQILVIGTAILIMHNFSEKSEQMLLAKHMGEASAGGREIKDPD